jgi:hypothetical protein
VFWREIERIGKIKLEKSFCTQGEFFFFLQRNTWAWAWAYFKVIVEFIFFSHSILIFSYNIFLYCNKTFCCNIIIFFIATKFLVGV